MKLLLRHLWCTKASGVWNKPLLLQIQSFNRNVTDSSSASQPGVWARGKVDERDKMQKDAGMKIWVHFTEPNPTEINGCYLCSYLQVPLNLLEFTMCWALNLFWYTLSIWGLWISTEMLYLSRALQILQTCLLHTFPNPFHLLRSHSTGALCPLGSSNTCMSGTQSGLLWTGLKDLETNFSFALDPAVLYSATWNLQFPSTCLHRIDKYMYVGLMSGEYAKCMWPQIIHHHVAGASESLEANP